MWFNYLKQEDAAALKETFKDVFIRDPKGREVLSVLLYSLGVFSPVSSVNMELHNYGIELLKLLDIDAEELKRLLVLAISKEKSPS